MLAVAAQELLAAVGTHRLLDDRLQHQLAEQRGEAVGGRRLQDQRMKAGIGGKVGRQVEIERLDHRTHGLVRGVQTGDDACVCPAGGTADGVGFKHAAKDEDLLEIVVVPFGHEGALAVGAAHEKLGLKLSDRGADGGARDAAERRQFLFLELRAGGEFARENAAAQLFISLIAGFRHLEPSCIRRHPEGG
ncbi:hypothetical protein NRB_40420 [Novosphingobium sp. 11B]